MTTNNVDIRLEDKELIALIHEVFKLNPSGKKLLNKLTEMYLYTPCASFERPDWFVYFRDGENHVIRTIHQAIATYGQIKD